MTEQLLSMKDLERKFNDTTHEQTLTNLTNACIDDLKKFYNCQSYKNTAVNVGRRDGPLASNILNSYPPTIIARAFTELPGVLKVNKEDLIRVVG